MQFSEADGFLRAAYITGPTHNLLGLKLGTEPGEPRAVNLGPVGLIQQPRIDPDEVAAAVKYAADLVSAATGRAVHISAFCFVPDDTPRYSAYAWMALKILERLVGGFDAGGLWEAHRDEFDRDRLDH